MKSIHSDKRFFLFTALILFILSGIAMSYNIHSINRKVNRRLEDALKLAEITLPQAVWQLNGEYLDNFINALFLEERIVYVGIDVLPVQKNPVRRTRTPFEQKPLSFFKESSQFIVGTRNLFYEGEKSGTIDIAVSRKGLYRELLLNTLSAVALMGSVMIVIGFYYIRLKHSERKYRELYDNAIEAVFQTTPEGRIVSANPSMVRILGFDSLQELISAVTDIGEQIYVNHAHRREFVRLMEENNSVSGFETRFFRKDRKMIWVSVSARTVQDKNGKILRYHGMFADITGSKEKEKAEREREIAEALNLKLTASIRYASVIQNALLPTLEDIKTCLPDSFLIWMPKDIVGGDMIFFSDYSSQTGTRTHDRCSDFLIAVIDCTGHGVPGALLSMLAYSELRRISDAGCREPAEILSRLNLSVKTLLKQHAKEAVQDEGMDAAVCFISRSEGTLIFAGAKLPLIYVRENGLNLIKGDKYSIGYKRSDTGFEFTGHTVRIEENMSVYMASDGFHSQLGGEKKIQFGKKRFRNLLKENAAGPFKEQREVILEAFHSYRGEHEAVDDVTVIGFGFGRNV